MKRLTLTLATAFMVALALAPAARAEFGLKDFSFTYINQDASPARQAGSHPFAVNLTFDVNTKIDPEFGKVVPDGDVKALRFQLAPGFIGDTTAVPRCTTADFLAVDPNSYPACPSTTAMGVTWTQVNAPGGPFTVPVYNLVPPPGVAVKIGFIAYPAIPITAEIGVNEEAPYNVTAGILNVPQIVKFFGSSTQLWGVPADPVHDPFRGSCLKITPVDDNGEMVSNGICSTSAAKEPFLLMARSCTGPSSTAYEAVSWQEPNAEPDQGTYQAPGTTGCSKLGFSPTIDSKPSTSQAETGSGLDFTVNVHDEGLTNPTGLAQSDVKKVAVTLPEGVTINPSVGEGLDVCTPADLGRETLKSIPGEGCPNASKLGTLHLETPLVEESVEGDVFLAQQDDPNTTQPGAENPFDSLIALYMVLRNTNLGVIVKLPLKVEPDPKTGQLITTLEEAPQIPVGRFEFHFKEGARAPLVTPPACGTYKTQAQFTPWANPDQILTTTSSFEITSGVGGGPCPPGGVPPFRPHFEAGSLNNNAGSFSPFNMRLIRNDGEQDMTKFSSVLPPGELGSLKGVAKCPDAAVEIAKAKNGREEIASPSCPANSLIGHSLGGAGVGGALTYVPGQIYLGGPYNGDPLSVISITPAVAGPFDAGTVVVRLALTLNPETAEVEVDGVASDPIPHIIKGIPLKVRDLRVYVDRPNFTLNPTSCDESSARGTLFGGYLDVFSPADDVPVDLSTRFQAANCLNLGFKPNLKLNLRGGSKRGGHPGLKAIFTPRPGDANTAGATVTLPRSAFLDQAHIRTICTRVQFAAENCPPGSIYGHAKAITPLLDEPIEGPVILRSSNNKLPDLVLALKGLVDINVASRIDSKNGGIRNAFDVIPDAPVTKFTLTLQGGKKGLIINSRDLCKGRISRAEARFRAHNGRRITLRPQMKPQCGGKKR